MLSTSEEKFDGSIRSHLVKQMCVDECDLNDSHFPVKNDHHSALNDSRNQDGRHLVITGAAFGEFTIICAP